MQNGKVKFYNRKKRYGFITGEDGVDYFFHDTGLVSMRRDGTKRLYKARPEGLEEVRAFLDQFWGRSLDLLKKAAEQEQQGETID